MKFPLVGPLLKILKAMGSVTGIMKLYGRQQSLHSNHICLLLTENLSSEMHCDLCYLHMVWFFNADWTILNIVRFLTKICYKIKLNLLLLWLSLIPCMKAAHWPDNKDIFCQLEHLCKSPKRLIISFSHILQILNWIFFCLFKLEYW